MSRIRSEGLRECRRRGDARPSNLLAPRRLTLRARRLAQTPGDAV